MLRFHRKSKGFTLIELMIVVAIIGILAAIAIPRFANLIDRAREARTQGNLGAIRSAMSIYYGTNDGIWPGTIANLDDDAYGGPFLQSIPTVLLPSGMGGHAETSDETITLSTTTADCTGKWFYSAAADDGVVRVDCAHEDSGGDQANTW